MADLLRARPHGPALLRGLLAADEPVVAPGVYDALGGRIAEQAGFDALYMTGFGASASLLGRPDVGLLGLAEMVDNARRIVAATDLPVIADADTGYGNPVNVIRTVQEYEQAGVAGLHLEDQVLPKRCGHMQGKSVIDGTEFVRKIEAAVSARRDPDLVVIARTDARSTHGIEEALDRARRCRDAGADVLFVEALEGEDELRIAADQLAGTPLLFNWVDGGRTPPLSLDRIVELGYRVIIHPVTTVLAATAAMHRALDSIHRHGTPAEVMADHPSFDEFSRLIGLDEVTELERRFES